MDINVGNDNNMTVSAQPREIYEAINLKYAMSYVLKTLDEELTPEYIECYFPKNLCKMEFWYKEGAD